VAEQEASKREAVRLDEEHGFEHVDPLNRSDVERMIRRFTADPFPADNKGAADFAAWGVNAA
jgi:hypothetical protein